MEDPTIYILLGAIRNFSNEVTVRALADKLGVSNSTLMRCKNGRWPRSLKPSSMRAVLDGCRDRFFGGDEEDLAASIIAHYRFEHVDEDAVRALEDALAEGGYDAFLELLIAQAMSRRNGQGPQDRSTPAESEAVPAEAEPLQPVHTTAQDAAVVAQPSPPESTPPVPDPVEAPLPDTAATSEIFGEPDAQDTAIPDGTQATRLHDLAFALPLGAVLIMGVLDVSLTGPFEWALAHRPAFIALSLALAVAPALCGVLVDSPIAWHRYKREHPDAVLTPHNFWRVAKFGDPEDIVRGAGRFNLTPIYLFFQPMCNLLSTLTLIALFSFLVALPGFCDFFRAHNWIELFKVAFVAATFLSYGHMREQLRLPVPDPRRNPYQDNPDTFLPSRLHVWANMVYLVWLISLFIIMLMGYLAFSAVQASTQPMPAIALWPYLQSMLFFAHTCASPMAPRLHTVSVGMLLPSVAAVSGAFALPALVWYLPSPVSHAFVVLGIAFTGLAYVWGRRHSSEESPAHDWFEAGQSFGAYAAAMTCTVLALVVVGFLTSTFL